MVDIKSIHMNPEYWGADASEFNPLRFSPEIKRHQAAYLPFGVGPRLCVGMRFALLGIKLSLARLLLKYDVLATPDTPDKLRFSETGGFPVSVLPIYIAIKPRQ